MKMWIGTDDNSSSVLVYRKKPSKRSWLMFEQFYWVGDVKGNYTENMCRTELKSLLPGLKLPKHGTPQLVELTISAKLLGDK